jgi:hypothetical protein
MKKTLLTIALAAATMPFSFAAQTPTTNAPATDNTQPVTTAKAKKHSKTRKHAAKKTQTNSTGAATAPAKQ